MVALNFVFLLLAILIFASISIPFLILFFFGLRKRSRWMKWLGGIPASLILGAAFCGFCLLIYGFIHPWSETTNPKTIRQTFVHNFEFDPGADLFPKNQRIYCLADFGCLHLKFGTSPSTFEKVRALGFEPTSSSEFTDGTGGGAPKWWVWPDKESTMCFKHNRWKGTFATNRAYLFYDAASQEVYFYSEGID
jgi:hypothetical protein